MRFRSMIRNSPMFNNTYGTMLSMINSKLVRPRHNILVLGYFVFNPGNIILTTCYYSFYSKGVYNSRYFKSRYNPQ